MNINIDFDTSELILKPYIIKIKEKDSYQQKYYDSSLFIEFNWLWFQIELNIPYKKLKGEKD